MLSFIHPVQSKFLRFAFATMPRGELAVLLLFLAVLVIVYSWSTIILLGWSVRCLRRRPAPKRARWRKICRGAVLSLAAVGVLCMGYAYFVEPYWPRVSTYQIATSKLPKGAGPIRVVHISDTHCDAKVRLEDRLPEIIAGLKPDLILFTGDAVNSSEGIGVFRRLMTRLSAIAPTYAVRGNWEYESYRDVDLYTGTGVRELRGQVVLKDIRGTPVYLVGVAWPDWTAAKRLQDLPPPGGLSIMMYHTPDLVSQIPIKSDLVLVGHTHGGQIALPLYGGMITLAREGKKYERDMYDLPGGQKLHVSRGIGMEGGNAPRMRFFSRPDVSVIEIVPRERP